MYAETDFVLALLKDDDWLQENAREIYKKNDDLWTSRYTLIELMLIAYRENMNVLRVVAEAIELIDVKGEIKEVEAAASYVEEEDFTPFDALHLVASGEEKIVSSDKDYREYSETRELED
ncbi:PIN domain-containing protein [Candidatus Nanohalobium constans]|uniref:PIN domain containing protein n=1 Tax=Candidatus Nanohalobium constans TaxID=2565781 RepID=A0A5Q0UHI5_9ARCH|nr:PIN domain-containing protein [Candidatus Nanohalobium constans]QGA81046.1 PIN domain containing protein [Candidatus Nanohalobium constans]